MNGHEQLLKAFIQHNAVYYMAHMNEDSKYSFNFPAFFFGFFWLLYRKFDKFAGTYVFVQFCLVVIVGFVIDLENPDFEWIGSTIICVVYSLNFILAIKANYLYLRFAKSEIDRLSALHLDKYDLIKQLQLKGGTDKSLFCPLLNCYKFTV